MNRSVLVSTKFQTMSKIGLMDLMTGAITEMNLIGLSIQRKIVTKIVSI
jgi:hypothetical protein